MVLGQIFSSESVIVNLESTDKDELFAEMLEPLVAAHPELNREDSIRALEDRESKMTTGIMHGVAIPHAVVMTATGIHGAIGISRSGIDYDSLDKSPVHLVFMILTAEGETERHVQVLKQLASVLQIPGFIDNMVKSTTPAEVCNLLNSAEESLTEL
jgi:nitrogen PTS system EIIA component